jgi:medium-chain acyl-[acyl-carrier-protein] hydrolase
VNDKSSNIWILFPRPNQTAALHLFCFHYAGGSAQVFYGWLGHLPPSVEIRTIKLPGRGHKLGEPQVRRLSPLSGIAERELLPYMDKSFVFFGHSMGALLCFEMARSLRRENRRQPIHLFVSATEAPHRRSPRESLSGLPRGTLVKKLREFDGAPSEALQNSELLDLMLPTIRADFELCETCEYHPEPRWNAP